MSAPLLHALRSISAANKVVVNRCQLTLVKHYARKNWNNRQPLRVLVGDKTIEPHRDKPLAQSYTDPNKSEASKSESQSFVYGQKTRFKLPENIVYERLQEGDKKFGPLIMNAKSRKHRHKDGLILLEGKRLILEAIWSGLTIRNLYFDRLEVLEGLPFKDFTANLYKVTHSHMKVWSDMSTPPGIMALCEQPSSDLVSANQSAALPITVVCDNIRDPGNMGTILRSAVAVGCDRVVAPKGCVDAWEPKVLRAGAGAHLRCPLVCGMGWEAVGHYLPKHTTLFLADNNTQTPGRRQKTRPRSLVEDIASIEQDSYTEVDPDSGESVEIDGTFLRKKVLDLFTDVPLDTQSLFEVDFSPLPHITVVIGGETEGLSVQAKKLCYDKAGEKVYVPMTQHTDSLNAGVALSVILFEVKRQLVGSQVRAEQGQVRTQQGQVPLEQGQVPAEQGQVPAEQGQVPLEQGQVPAEQGQVPAEQGQVPLEQGQVPAEQGQVPAEQGQVPLEQGQVPAEQGQVPAEQGQVPLEQACLHTLMN